MKRGVLIGYSMLGVLVIILGVALAHVGTQLDKTRLSQVDLQTEIDDLEQEVDALNEQRDTLASERDTLKADLEERIKALEAEKAKQEQAQAPSPAPATP